MTINLERKKKEQTKGKTNRRMPICNPTIQLVVLDLYTKYEVSILNGCGDIFDEKVLRNRAYPENANSNTCAPNTLKFHTFCDLCVTKQCFKFEFDILKGSGVIAT